eukprot:s203_g3.t1
MVIWSLAELRQQSPDLVQLLPSLLGRFAKAEPTKLYPRDVSEVLWAIATLRQLPEVVSASDRLFKKACKLDGTFSERDVAMILWSAGIVRLGEATSAPLLQRMCKEARSTASSFSQPPQISNACLGLALSGWKDAVLMDAFAHTMAKKIHDADADVATSCLPPLMYSFAKLQMPGREPLLNACVVKFHPVGSTTSDMALGDLAWSFEKLDSENRPPRPRIWTAGQTGLTQTARYTEFPAALQSEVSKRGISLEQVEQKERGHDTWLEGEDTVLLLEECGASSHDEV